MRAACYCSGTALAAAAVAGAPGATPVLDHNLKRISSASIYKPCSDKRRCLILNKPLLSTFLCSKSTAFPTSELQISSAW